MSLTILYIAISIVRFCGLPSTPPVETKLLGNDSLNTLLL